MNESIAKRFLYSILYFLMDIETLMWDFTEFIIKPIVWLRRKVAYKISKFN